MKFAVIVSVLSCSASFAFADNTINLAGGTSATVDANVKTRVNCSATEPKAAKSTCHCDRGGELRIDSPSGSSSYLQLSSVEACFAQAFGRDGEYSQFCSGN
jgi:hypothetical protein